MANRMYAQAVPSRIVGKMTTDGKRSGRIVTAYETGNGGCYAVVFEDGDMEMIRFHSTSPWNVIE